jgi:bifunctional DNA-binding transcriptional regulator/antitoxin component of YhaV-PrlF toxin-antitoxin module
MSRMKGMTSSVNVARPTSESYRTTIPTLVAAQLGLSAKDVIDWKVDKANGVWFAVIHRVGPKP